MSTEETIAAFVDLVNAGEVVAMLTLHIPEVEASPAPGVTQRVTLMTQSTFSARPRIDADREGLRLQMQACRDKTCDICHPPDKPPT